MVRKRGRRKRQEGESRYFRKLSIVYGVFSAIGLDKSVTIIVMNRSDVISRNDRNDERKHPGNLFFFHLVMLHGGNRNVSNMVEFVPSFYRYLGTSLNTLNSHSVSVSFEQHKLLLKLSKTRNIYR